MSLTEPSPVPVTASGSARSTNPTRRRTRRERTTGKKYEQSPAARGLPWEVARPESLIFRWFSAVGIFLFVEV
jgi:hypothetical protein